VPPTRGHSAAFCNRLGCSRVIAFVRTSSEVHDRRFEDFYAFDYGKLVAALRFVTGDSDLARDSVDEACARALERLRRGDEIDVLAAWVRVVARNVARGRLRRLTSERRARARLVARPSAAESFDDAAAAIDVHAALAALTRRQREVVVMHYFLDQTVETIATELEIPTGTVKSALSRARTVLAHLLSESTHFESTPEPAREQR
jgi:RNA polymerase sigma factor (sigma-70 family)